MTLTVYQYDSAGLYAGDTLADESPLEPGVYLYPARSTATPPPEHSDDQWPRWNGVSWQLIPKPTMPPAPSAAEKLAAFLSQNPDVAALVSGS